MNQTIRERTFETNSSSIHCLTVRKDAKINEVIFLKAYDIFPYKEEETKYFGWEFKTLEEKLRYLWTICCKCMHWNYENAFTTYEILKKIFPNTIFYDPKSPDYVGEYYEVPYLEDFEYGFEDYDWNKTNKLLQDENFLKRWFSEGYGAFTSRDYDNWKEEDFVYNIRAYERNEEYDTAEWEG